VIEDIKILEAVERYISGQMSPDERVYFEQLRKSNPEVDQMVVEHTFFLQQMSRFDEVKKLKSTLNETHIHLAEKGLIRSPRLQGKARVVYLYNRYKRVAAIAASIAGITALTISALVWSLSPAKPANKQDLANLSRTINDISQRVNKVEDQNSQLTQKINDVSEQTVQPQVEYTSGGTGFLIDAKGFLVTNAHVVKNAKNVAVQNSDGRDLNAKIVYTDVQRDIAILKITDKRFKASATIPYTVKKTPAELAEEVFTLGYPRNEIVYGRGYVAARTGYQGDSLALQLTIAANQGNSGGPVLNSKGEVIGIVSRKQTNAEGAVFALQSKYIYEALNELQKKDTSYRNIKIPSSSTLKEKERTQQVSKLTDFVYMVKVN
jgi:serine protease Do